MIDGYIAKLAKKSGYNYFLKTIAIKKEANLIDGSYFIVMV
jgi:hypothetical protein